MKRANLTRSLGSAVLLLLLPAAAAAQTPAAGTGRRVITNKELEPARLRREAQEAEYERTRHERGLPSQEELRRQAEERDRRLSEWARQAAAERRQAELLALQLRAAQRSAEHYFDPQPSQAAVVYVDTYIPSGFYPYQYGTPVIYGDFGVFGRRGHFRAPFGGRGRFHNPRWWVSPRPAAPFGRGAHPHSRPVSPGPSPRRTR